MAISTSANEGFEEKMKRLTKELGGQFEKSHELEKKIKNNLNKLDIGEQNG